MNLNRPYKIIASNQITIQSVDNVAIYEAVISSSVGELIDPSVQNVVLTLNIFNNFEDVTSKFSKIIWKRYIYDFDVPVLDPQWGADLDGKTNITINTDDFNGKVKIECKIYDMITGTERMIAGSYIVLTDVKDLRPSTTPPTNPKENDLWLDTSVTPPVLKIYIGGKWNIVNDSKFIYDDINQLIKDLEDVNGKIEDLNQEMGNMSLLNIDNKKDYLWTYADHLTSTNSIIPKPGYKCQMSKTNYKFKGSVYLTTFSNQVLLYDNIKFSTNKFTINMWVSPGNTLPVTPSNQFRLLSTGDALDKSMFTLWNYSPTGSQDGQNIRLVAEFGNDDTGARQYKDLTDPKRFEEGKWYMITITYDGATKKFDFYKDGAFWNTYTPKKINAVTNFGMIKSGWYTENLTILNDVVLQLQDIKSIYTKNRPFSDLFATTPDATRVENIQMTIS